jgi:hypothetical protein
MHALIAARNELHQLAVHLVARARVQQTGRFSLRVTPDGFGTPEMGDSARRVRISGSHLVVESDVVGGAAATVAAIDGASLAELAAVVGVDLAQPLNVGHDTPPLGDTSARISLDAAGAAELADWFGQSSTILDAVMSQLPGDATPTLPRLWPEHFDVAIEAGARPGVRVNLGGSPGDGSSGDEPYLYVGPWTADRPGSADFWNAPYGALRTRSQLANDPAGLVAAGVAFLLEGYGRLRDSGDQPA